MGQVLALPGGDIAMYLPGRCSGFTLPQHHNWTVALVLCITGREQFGNHPQTSLVGKDFCRGKKMVFVKGVLADQQSRGMKGILAKQQ